MHTDELLLRSFFLVCFRKLHACARVFKALFVGILGQVPLIVLYVLYFSRDLFNIIHFTINK